MNASQELDNLHCMTASQGTDEDTEALVRWRGANDVFFTGRRNASVTGFQTYIKDMELEGKVEALWAKKKWENLKQKYK
ncbi:unnamed protein product, partial [Gadus morhua 'NCC']